MNEAEYLFFDKMKNKKIIKSSTEDDMFKHIDFVVDGISYDVKEEKKMRRSDIETSLGIIWVEMKNVRGEKGWLCSEVDKIAFKQGEVFYIVDRQKLLEYTRETVGFGEVSYFPQYKKLYQRRYRKDLLTYFFLSDITHLIEEVI